MSDGRGLKLVGAEEGRKLWLLGDVRTIKVVGAETGGELTILEQVVAPGAGASLHRHGYQEVFYVLDGELEFTGLEDGERVTFAVRTGGTVHAAAGVAHGYRNAGAEAARFLAIVQPAGVEEFFDAAGIWLDEDGAVPADATEPSTDAVLAAAARHGIEFLPGS